VEDGKVVRIGDIPAFSLLPITVSQRVLVPVVLGAAGTGMTWSVPSVVPAALASV